jgi:ankyrin repeat protein
MAVSHNNAPIVAQLPTQLSALIMAVQEGSPEKTAALLAQVSVSRGILEQTDVNGNTPLIIAAREGNIDIVTMLIDKKDKKTIDAGNNNNDTALLCAAGEGHLDVVTLLVKKGASMTHENKQGASAWAKAMSPPEGVHSHVLRFFDEESKHKQVGTEPERLNDDTDDELHP